MAEIKTVVSKQFSLQWRDALRGLLISIITAVLTVVQTSIDAGIFNVNWKLLWQAALTAGVAYILKNWLLEPAKVITTTDNNKAAEQVEVSVKPDDNEKS